MTLGEVINVKQQLTELEGFVAAVVPDSTARRVLTTRLREIAGSLAALNGEQEEVWTVSRRHACHEDLAFRLHDHNSGDLVASDLDEATARRIARLPALERAAREVVDANAKYGHMHDTLGDGDIRTGRAWDHMRNASHRLRAALTDKPEA